jgi:hypothetical protein
MDTRNRKQLQLQAAAGGAATTAAAAAGALLVGIWLLD